MPTQEETQAANAVAQLRTRIEERRRAGWEHQRKVAAGEVIGDELLPQLRDNRTMINLGREFLRAAERGNAPMVAAFIEEGFPAKFQDRLTGETALHISAATGARKVLRVLLGSGLCDFLLRDKGGRLASELAYLFGKDPAAARLLGIKERKQAEDTGITLTRRPKPLQ